MEQITRKDGEIYYGNTKCVGLYGTAADDAYRMFRDDYNEAQGRKAFSRLNRLGQRTERVRGHKSYCSDEIREGWRSNPFPDKRVRCHLMGIVSTGYCWSIGLWDMPDIDDDRFSEYLLWLFSEGGGTLTFAGRRSKSGRTSVRRRETRNQFR